MPQLTIDHTAAGWPYLDPDNYVQAMPAYTQELADKLQHSDAAVAQAENAAYNAQQSATAAQQSATDAAASAAHPMLVKYLAANTSVASGTESSTTMNQALELGADFHTGAPSSWEPKIPKAGVYRVTIQGNWSRPASGTGYGRMILRKNGSAGPIIGWAECPLSTANDQTTTSTFLVSLAAGDTVCFRFLQNNGAAVNLLGSDQYRTFLSLEWLRAAS